MNTPKVIFKNRQEAGQKLAKVLIKYLHASDDLIILGMPRGGVVVAYEIAKELKAPLDIIVSRKVGMPSFPEYAIGAVAPDDIYVFNKEATSNFLSSDGMQMTIKTIADREMEEANRRIKLYRKDKPPLDLKGKTAIIVDDGVATGLSAIAAIRAARKMQPKRIIFACGVAAKDSVKLLEKEVDEVISLSVPENFHAVGQWYKDFGQTTDEEVIDLLSLAEKICCD